MKWTEIRPLPEWRELDPDRWRGVVLVLGATDSGKSTLVHWLAGRLARDTRPLAWIDADIGQATLGLPAAMSLAIFAVPPAEIPRPEATFFVGGTSPRGHMLPVLVGLQRLRERAEAHGAAVALVDTSGLVAEAAGGGALKEWKIELLRPSVVIALQRERELEHLLGPLRRRSDLAPHLLPVSPEARRRSPEERSARRRRQFRDYFAAARPLSIAVRSLPIHGLKKSAPSRLLALLDADGFSPALGLLLDHNRTGMEILTPLPGSAGIAGLRLGDLRIDPETGEEI